MQLIISFFLMLMINLVRSINHMPCTENVDAASLAQARQILEDSVPQGYQLFDYYPVTQTGRNPHRWICHYHRVDNQYRQDCDYLTDLRTAFRRECPAGCEISQVVVSQSPNRNFIEVQFLVNCGCRRIPRRRRSSWLLYAYNHEKSVCTGLPHSL